MTMPDTAVTTNDRPASPREKLLVVRQLARENGNAFDENLWRRTINDDYRERGYGAAYLLEENVPNAESFGEDPRVARAVRMNDERAMQEMRDERLRLQDAVSEEAFREREKAALRSENERLRQQLAELTGARANGTYIPDTNPLDRTPQMGGFPTENNTVTQMREWAAERGYTLKWNGYSKKDMLEQLRRQQEAADTPEPRPMNSTSPDETEESARSAKLVESLIPAS